MRVIRSRGWHLVEGVTRHAVAADSPRRRLFVSFETGADQLREMKAGRSAWGNAHLIRRLRGDVARHRPVLAVTVEPGERDP